MKSCAVLAALGIAFSVLGCAQGLGTITGTVADPSGAAVPGAEVKVTAAGTGVTRSAFTNAVGQYVILSLSPARYTLAVGTAGFRKFVQEGSYLVALDKHTGKNLWRVTRDEQSSWSAPLVVAHNGRKQVVVSASNKVRSCDAATGKLIWECAGLGSHVIPAPVAAGDLVLVMSGHRNPNLLAIRLRGRRPGGGENGGNLRSPRRRHSARPDVHRHAGHRQREPLPAQSGRALLDPAVNPSTA